MSKRRTIRLPGLGGLALSAARPILAIVLALSIGAVVIWVAGANPIKAYAALLRGSIGSGAAWANTGVRATPLLFGGFAVGLGLQAGLLSIGGDGQMYLGGAAAAAVAITPLPVPAWLHLLLALIAGFVGGALGVLLPAYFRAHRGVSEVNTTFMMNYVAAYLVSWLVHEPSPLAEKGAFYPMSPPILPSARLPILVKGTSLHAGLIIALTIGVILHLALRYTPFGFRIRMIGKNPEAARYAGVNVARQIFIVLLISGGIAGLGGASMVLGLKLRLFDFFTGGVGYEGLALAIVANGSPLGIIAGSIFFGALKAGAGRMQISTGIPASMALVIEALTVLIAIAIGFAERRRAIQLREEPPAEEVA